VSVCFPRSRLFGHRPIDHLIETELLVPKAEARNAVDLDRVATVAAVLLFGKEKIVRRELPTAETVLALETSINTPLTASKWLNIIDSVDHTRHGSETTCQDRPNRHRRSSGQCKRQLAGVAEGRDLSGQRDVRVFRWADRVLRWCPGIHRGCQKGQRYNLGHRIRGRKACHEVKRPSRKLAMQNAFVESFNGQLRDVRGSAYFDHPGPICKRRRTHWRSGMNSNPQSRLSSLRHRHRLAVGVAAGDVPLCLRQRDISVRGLHSGNLEAELRLNRWIRRGVGQTYGYPRIFEKLRSVRAFVFLVPYRA
jgi:hypothetical protein